MEDQQTTVSGNRLLNDPIMQPVSWETLLRRRSSMSVGLRRSSLLSVSLFDNPSFHGMNDVHDFEHDPFAPLSINDGGLSGQQQASSRSQQQQQSLQQQHQQLQQQQHQLQQQQQQLLQQSPLQHHHLFHQSPQQQPRHRFSGMMNDRSESSVPSLSASSYSSNGSIMSPPHGTMQKFQAVSQLYEAFPSFSPRITKTPVQMPMKIMSNLATPPPMLTKDNSPSAAGTPTTNNVTPRSTNSSAAPVATPGGSNGSSSTSPSNNRAPVPVSPEDEEELNQHRFKPFHEEKWTLRYKELLEFHKEHGHSAVPHTYPKNPQLARWVKRQRRQYKLRRDGRASTMTSERLEMLSSVGFVWDSHDVNWREKLESLRAFRKEHGHCNVPSNYVDKKLATWVKCQRRQYKLYWDGKPSAMSPERILELEKVGFEWEIRSTVPRKAGAPPVPGASPMPGVPQQQQQQQVPPPPQAQHPVQQQQHQQSPLQHQRPAAIPQRVGQHDYNSLYQNLSDL